MQLANGQQFLPLPFPQPAYVPLLNHAAACLAPLSIFKHWPRRLQSTFSYTAVANYKQWQTAIIAIHRLVGMKRHFAVIQISALQITEFTKSSVIWNAVLNCTFHRWYRLLMAPFWQSLLGKNFNMHIGYQNAEHRRRAIHGVTGHWDNVLEWTMNCTQDRRRHYTQNTSAKYKLLHITVRMITSLSTCIHNITFTELH